MKKSLLALAAMTAFAGVASAQSSVTMFGRVDLSVARNIGTSTSKVMQNGSGSRLGMRGVEDLGGGLKALFHIETRFQADTGAADNFNVNGFTPTGTVISAPTTANNTTLATNRFWGARSVVGLSGGFGEITLGREYTTAFLVSQLRGDIWGYDTVASHSVITGLGIAKVRNDSAFTYKFAAGGFGAQFQIAEATDAINTFAKKPVNFALSYGAGPLYVGFGHEITGRRAADTEKMSSLVVGYQFGPVRPNLYIARGVMTNGADRSGMVFSVAVNAGAGQFRAAVGKLKNETTAGVSTDVNTRASLGYHHDLSKRTTLYADFARESEPMVSKTGFDFGVKHNF